MFDLPRWAKVRALEVATWQWLGLGVGFAVATIIIIAGNWIGRRHAGESEDVPSQQWQALRDRSRSSLALVWLCRTSPRCCGSADRAHGP